VTMKKTSGPFLQPEKCAGSSSKARAEILRRSQKGRPSSARAWSCLRPRWPWRSLSPWSFCADEAKAPALRSRHAGATARVDCTRRPGAPTRSGMTAHENVARLVQRRRRVDFRPQPRSTCSMTDARRAIATRSAMRNTGSLPTTGERFVPSATCAFRIAVPFLGLTMAAVPAAKAMGAPTHAHAREEHAYALGI
jgi:hypothetical protein